MAKGWYIVHTYSGYEQKIEKLIRFQMEQDSDFAAVCLDVKVPIEIVVEMKDGVRKEVKHKLLPGYILVELDMPEDNTWVKYTSQIRRINGVTGFVTATRSEKPSPMTESELNNILQRTGEIKDTFKPKQSFAIGEQVKITEGPFSAFTGKIDEISADKSRLKVIVEIFGRPTPVDIDFSQVEKV